MAKPMKELSKDEEVLVLAGAFTFLLALAIPFLPLAIYFNLVNQLISDKILRAYFTVPSLLVIPLFLKVSEKLVNFAWNRCYPFAKKYVEKNEKKGGEKHE